MVKRTVEGYEYVEFIYCGCRCGKTRSKYQERHLRRFIAGHINRLEHNPMWKGDNVGYFALHGRLKRHKKKTELCELCLVKPSKELACLDYGYKPNSMWAWLCGSCHKKWDNIGRRNLRH